MISIVQVPLPFSAARELVPGIAAVGEDVAQPGIERADRCEYARRAVAILDVGLVHEQADQIAFGVGDDVALAALDLLARVKPAWTAAFRSLHRLAVDDAGGRARLAPGLLARRHHQRG